MTPTDAARICARQLVRMPDSFAKTREARGTQYTPWRGPQSPETWKPRLSNPTGKKRRRRVITPKGICNDYHIAAEKYGVKPSTMCMWLSKRYNGVRWES